LRTGALGRDLPPDYGDWKNTYRRFCRWRDRGLWEALLERLIDEPDYEWLMIDAKPHQSSFSCGGCARRQPGHEPDKKGFNSKIHLAVDAHGMPPRILVTQGSTADCTQAHALIAGLDVQYLLADRGGYDTDAIIAQARQADLEATIPPKKNRKVPRDYDNHIYRQRHLIENTFFHLKRWRGIVTRYAKNTASFLAAVHIRCLALRLNIL
jgi:transposase